MIRQYLMVYNYNLGISNDRLINQFNKDFRDTSDSHTMDMGNVTGECKIMNKCNATVFTIQNSIFFYFAVMVETNEQEIIQRFVRTDKTLVTWDTLVTVFRLWAIGMVTAGIVFVFERLIYHLS